MKTLLNFQQIVCHEWMHVLFLVMGSHHCCWTLLLLLFVLDTGSCLTTICMIESHWSNSFVCFHQVWLDDQWSKATFFYQKKKRPFKRLPSMFKLNNWGYACSMFKCVSNRISIEEFKLKWNVKMFKCWYEMHSEYLPLFTLNITHWSSALSWDTSNGI